MKFALATTLTLRLLSFALLLQAGEMLFIIRSPIFKSVWSYGIVDRDLKVGLPFPPGFRRAIFGDGFRIVVFAQILLAFASFIWPIAPLFIALTLGHLLVTLRFRGSFNGGSDMMTFVVLTGVLILTLGHDESVQRLGLIYIAIQAIYSYIKAGLVKVREKQWRQGLVLPAFFSRSLFNDSKRLGVMLRFKPRVARALAFALILFELSLLLVPFVHGFVHIAFALAVIFHFATYRVFGLNRFFWIWLAAWPSIFYLASLSATLLF